MRYLQVLHIVEKYRPGIIVEALRSGQTECSAEEYRHVVIRDGTQAWQWGPQVTTGHHWSVKEMQTWTWTKVLFQGNKEQVLTRIVYHIYLNWI